MLRLLIVAFVLPAWAIGQTNTGSDLLEKSIEFHDPNGNWSQLNAKYYLEELRPTGPSGFSVLSFDNANSIFEAVRTNKGNALKYRVVNSEVTTWLNGKSELSAEEQEKKGLTDERAIMLRDYYCYLWGLPMKLQDEGTIVHDEVQESEFNDQPCYQIKITYEAEVGSDTWYYYFDKENYAMIGYRFYHDEEINDGEYITLEGLLDFNGMRIPQLRKWFVNKDDKYLGGDRLIASEISE